MKGKVHLAVVLTAALMLGLSASANAATQNVTLQGTSFTPADVTIDVGDTVHWMWVSGTHNVESGVGGVHDGNFRSGDPTGVPGTTFDVVFDQAFLDANPMPGNVYPYYCLPHVGLGMIGSVTVEVPVVVPTVSTWGITAMLLLLLAAGTVVFKRKLRTA